MHYMLNVHKFLINSLEKINIVLLKLLYMRIKKIYLKLSKREKGRLANILDNFGQVVAGSIIFPLIIDFKLSNSNMVIIGSILTSFLWISSLYFERSSYDKHNN